MAGSRWAGLAAGLLLAALLRAVSPVPDSSLIREPLAGVWASPGEHPETWSLEGSPSGGTILRQENGVVTLRLRCHAQKELCRGVDYGRKVKAELYWNGPALVQWESRDTHLILRRFVLVGNTLQVEDRFLTEPAQKPVIRRLHKLRGSGPR